MDYSSSLREYGNGNVGSRTSDRAGYGNLPGVAGLLVELRLLIEVWSCKFPVLVV